MQNSDADLEIIADSLRRVRFGLACFTVGWLLAGGIIAVAGWVNEWDAPKFYGLMAAAGIAALISGVMLLKNLRIEGAPVYQILKFQPAQIAWAYPGAIENLVNGIYLSTENLITLRLKDGRAYKLHSVRPADVPRILAVINNRAPQALIGYNAENLAHYRQSLGLA
jgi:hypothetical protein